MQQIVTTNILPLNDELRINFYLDAYIRSENELLSNRDIPNYFTTFFFKSMCFYVLHIHF
jgi:hypothetical protein